MEGLGVAKYHDALSASTWHLFRMSEYQAPSAAEKTVRFGSHQDTNLLSVVCQHEVEGLEMQTRDGQWVLVKPSPTSLVVMVGQALRVQSMRLCSAFTSHCIWLEHASREETPAVASSEFCEMKAVLGY